MLSLRTPENTTNAPPWYREITQKTIGDRKSTRLNSSRANISYAVFCLKKKKITSYLHSHSTIFTQTNTISRSFKPLDLSRSTHSKLTQNITRSSGYPRSHTLKP